MEADALQASERGGIPMAKQGKTVMEDFLKMFEGTLCRNDAENDGRERGGPVLQLR
jgi:hypothetical protein